MSFISRVFSGLTKSASGTPLLTAVSSNFHGFEHYTDAHSLNSYKESLYLYIAVSLIAKHATSVELELYKIKNTKGEHEEVFDHPILELLNSPNPFQTRRELLETSFSHYLLAGDVFWYVNLQNKEMYALRPDYVEVILSRDRRSILAYQYRHGEVQNFAPENIVHIKNPDPSDIVRGMGVVRPASVRIATEKEASTYQANFFKNQGRPDFVVFADEAVTEEKSDDFRARWKRTFGGNNAGQVGIFGSSVKDIRELNKTPKEMDFIASQHFLRDDILAALRVPKAMITSDDVNLANGQEAYRMFLQEAVVPVLDAFIDALNNRLMPDIDASLFFSYEDPTPNDREMLLKEVTELKKGGIITANEARAEYGYDLMEGADALSVAPSGQRQEVQEEAKAIVRRRPRLAKRLKAQEELVTLITTEPTRQMNSIFATKAMKSAFAKAYNDKVDRKATVLEAAILRYQEGLLERILATELQPAGFMDLQGEKIAAKQALGPVVVKLYKEGGQEALDALFRKAADTFFADNVLLAALEARIFFFTDSMTETTFEILKGKIVAGLSAGDGVEKIAGDLREYFKDWGVKRASMIARTETGHALSKAANDAYMQSSVVTGKEWITVGDDKVRHEHVENDGVIVAKGGTFPSGEAYPAEHSINCRCVLSPAV